MLTSIIIASLLFADPVPRVETVAGSLQFSVTRDGNGGDEVTGRPYTMLTWGRASLISVMVEWIASRLGLVDKQEPQPQREPNASTP